MQTTCTLKATWNRCGITCCSADLRFIFGIVLERLVARTAAADIVVLPPPCGVVKIKCSRLFLEHAFMSFIGLAAYFVLVLNLKQLASRGNGSTTKLQEPLLLLYLSPAPPVSIMLSSQTTMIKRTLWYWELLFCNCLERGLFIILWNNRTLTSFLPAGPAGCVLNLVGPDHRSTLAQPFSRVLYYNQNCILTRS
jgi:hypothetical protein